MSIIGKQLPEFTLDAFKKPELVKVSTADVLGKWSVFVFYPADFTFVCPTELEDVQNSYAEYGRYPDELPGDGAVGARWRA